MNDAWLTWKPIDVRIEEQQAGEEGRELRSLASEFGALKTEGAADAPDFQARADALLDRVRELPRRTDFAYSEPSDLAGIRAARPDGPRRLGFAIGDDAARVWMTSLPLLSVCTAERAAYRNFTNQIDLPESAVVRNPCREWTAVLNNTLHSAVTGYSAARISDMAKDMFTLYQANRDR